MELGGKTIEFFGFREKSYSYLIDDGSEDKKSKKNKKFAMKRKFKFRNYKNCLAATQLNETKNLWKKWN